jgi:hypothetical protein
VRKTLQLSIDDCAPAIVQRVVHKVNSIYGPARGSSAQATMSPTEDMVDDETSAPVVSTAQQAAAAAVDASLERTRIGPDTSGLLAMRPKEATAEEGDSMEIEPAAIMRFGINPLRVGTKRGVGRVGTKRGVGRAGAARAVAGARRQATKPVHYHIHELSYNHTHVLSYNFRRRRAL